MTFRDPRRARRQRRGEVELDTATDPRPRRRRWPANDELGGRRLGRSCSCWPPAGEGPPMKVSFATAELTPVARVGGLAEAAAGLVRGSPRRRCRRAGGPARLRRRRAGRTQTEVARSTCLMGRATPRVRRGHHAVAGRPHWSTCPASIEPHPYVDATGEGWPDNDHRFMAFSAAVAALVALEQPDVLHLNDWHTAAAVGMLPDRSRHGAHHPHPRLPGTSDRAWLEQAARRGAPLRLVRRHQSDGRCASSWSTG